jgi:SAM-dependent methyltransferase
MIEQNVRGAEFDDLAADYERFRVGYSSELYSVLERQGLRRGMSVLDAACGSGLSMEPLITRGLKLTGLDASASMLAAARAACPQASLVSGRVEALPFADHTFDGAICAQAFHWLEMEQAFAELIRVVKPGGVVAVWWKLLCHDEPLRAMRVAASAAAGREPVPDALSGGFGAFYRAPFAARTLRVLPFTARFLVDDWIGYERSRAATRSAYGSAFPAYLEALRSELLAVHGSGSARIDVRYTQFVYIGTTATS